MLLTFEMGRGLENVKRSSWVESSIQLERFMILGLPTVRRLQPELLPCGVLKPVAGQRWMIGGCGRCIISNCLSWLARKNLLPAHLILAPAFW